MLPLVSLKNGHFITPWHFLLFLCGIIWSLLFKTEVEQMNPSVLTFSCQQCFSVRWNKLPRPFIFYNQLSTAEHTHSPAGRLCQHGILWGTGSLCYCHSSKVLAREGLFWFSPPFLAPLHLLSPSALPACTTLVQSLFCKKELFGE